MFVSGYARCKASTYMAVGLSQARRPGDLRSSSLNP